MASNHVSKVAIVGAGGNVGRFMTEALLEKGKHEVTALTREDSQSKLPEGVKTKIVDYSKPETLVDALRGQDALVITISGRAPIKDIEEKLVRAAAEADVKWILPNEWSPDSADDGIVKDVFLFGMKVATRNLIQEIGKSSYVAVSCGFWYEYSLAIANNYGIDFAKKEINMYDDGQTKICTSTWPQVGRAVAAILSLPIQAENGNDKQASLDGLRNKVVYINSFNISQADMLASAQRVTGTKEGDWKITKHDSHERFDVSLKFFKEGKFKTEGFTNFRQVLVEHISFKSGEYHRSLANPNDLVVYSRIFFPNGGGDFEHKGTINNLLGLPKEDLDEATKVAMERQLANEGGH
ncbi:hypothetical protein LTR42_010104 [Elasticomyces elasticus]|nr:hypothetical protein LTR42_010104 [Elasticomyces elasticus]